MTTTDFMTAEAFNFPWDFLQRVMNRIVNEVHGYVCCVTTAGIRNANII